MKTRFFFATLLLLAFGTAKAQDTVPAAPKQADPTINCNKPDMSQFPELMRKLGVNLQHLTDSVDWKSFEKDMEKWGAEMEEWGREMEKWGSEFEKKFNQTSPQNPSMNDGSQVRSIIVEGSGDMRIEQCQDGFSLRRDRKNTSDRVVMNGTLILKGSSDYEVALPQLDEVVLCSSGDVIGKGAIKGQTLRIVSLGSGDINLDVDYDTINVEMTGSGNVILKGRCKEIWAQIMGSGDLKVPQLQYAESKITATGSGEVLSKGHRDVVLQKSNREQHPVKKSLFFNAYWNGFEAGLNTLFSAPSGVANADNVAQSMELRPLRSWYFGFNIADVGIAFNRRHTAGLFTGVGLGWNNFSWNNSVTVEYDHENEVYTFIPIVSDQHVKNSKHGALFLQVPLMIEVRPTRSLYIDAGVTGGLRIAQWNRVKFADGTRIKRYYGSNIDHFKLDASLRVGSSSDDLGFFANFALLPIFDMNNTKVHPISFGFSVDF